MKLEDNDCRVRQEWCQVCTLALIHFSTCNYIYIKVYQTHQIAAIAIILKYEVATSSR